MIWPLPLKCRNDLLLLQGRENQLKNVSKSHVYMLVLSLVSLIDIQAIEIGKGQIINPALDLLKQIILKFGEHRDCFISRDRDGNSIKVAPKFFRGKAYPANPVVGELVGTPLRGLSMASSLGGHHTHHHSSSHIAPCEPGKARKCG